MNLSEKLKRLHACREAVLWTEKYATLAEAWKLCERGDWMLWLCGKMADKKGWPKRQDVVLAACDCAELSIHFFETKYPNDPRVRNCLEITRKWAKSEATIEQVRIAAYASSAAAYASSAAAYDAYAAYAAYYAYDAYAAYASSSAAAASAASASAAYSAAYDAAYSAAYDASMLRRCADICRKNLKPGNL
jgi:hypothetical protein